MAVLAFFSLLALIAQALECGPTCDEPAHLAAAVATWRTGDPAHYRVNPPLHKLISAVAVEAICDAKLTKVGIGVSQRGFIPTRCVSEGPGSHS